jgi:UDP-GlcNAc:undecaprenyl-phosphate/decaprenyl-phosphate GlcNAc-1-phosphate transferase
MTRRILTKKSPFSPDRGHAHHKLLDRGFTKLQTLAVMGLAHLALVLAGIRLLGAL